MPKSRPKASRRGVEKIRSRPRGLVWGLAAIVVLLAVGWAWDWRAAWTRMDASRAIESNASQAAVEKLERSGHAGRDGRVQLLLSRAYTRLGLYGKALAAVAAAEAGGGPVEELAAHRDLVLASRGDATAAERLLDLHAGLLPPREVLEALVRSKLFLGETQALEPILAQWQRDFPRDGLALYYRGRIAELGEEPALALEQYRQAWAMQSTLYKAAYRGGVMAREVREYAAAVELFAQCRGGPLQPIAVIEEADCLWQLGQVEAASSRLAEVLEMAPAQLTQAYLAADEFADTDRAALLAARIAHSRQEYAQAVEYARRVLEHNHRSFAARNVLIPALRRLGQSEAADAEARIEEAMVENRRRCHDLRSHLESHPDDLDARCELAECYFTSESLAEAQVELDTIFRADPGQKRAHRVQADVFREQARQNPDLADRVRKHEQLSQ
jgi:tetratricopeptide (TPR) repeat protein